MPISSWLRGGFPVWRLALSTLHKRSPPVWILCCPCECFVFQAFTLKTVVNQKKTNIVWMGEYYFREINYVYIRARSVYSQSGFRLIQRDVPASPARSHATWSILHKSPTISHKSWSRPNKSGTCGNNSRTFWKGIASPLNLPFHHPSASDTSVKQTL